MKSSNLALLPSSPSIPSATSALETGAQWCPNLSDPMDCSMPGFPILYHFPKFKQHLGFSGSTFTATLTFSPSGFPWLRESSLTFLPSLPLAFPGSVNPFLSTLHGCGQQVSAPGPLHLLLSLGHCPQMNYLMICSSSS